MQDEWPIGPRPSVKSSGGRSATYERPKVSATAVTHLAVAAVRNLVLGLAACGDNTVVLDPVPDLTPAIDTNPDPDIVEVSLEATATTVDYVGVATPVLAYRDASSTNPASVPGPLIEAKVGDRLIVHFRNATTVDTTIHWHGLRLPIGMDGDPAVSGPVPPGGTFDYDFVLRDGGLYWYHPHIKTDEQIELGLQGPLLVRAPDEPAIAVERVLVLDDIDLLADGSVRIEPTHDDLVLGRRDDIVLVNGKPPGSITAHAGGTERWRIVNTSNGRFFDLRLGGQLLRVIGWDGGLIPQPYDVDHLLVAPGERYDVVVTLDRPVDLESIDVVRGHGGLDRGSLLVRVELSGSATPDTVPATGPSLAPLVVDANTTTRRFKLTEMVDGSSVVFLINNQRWPLNTPVDVPLGDVEVWEIVNDAEAEHPVHVHGHFFQLIDRDGVPEPLRGLKDTVVLDAHSTLHAALRYDEPGKWMFHCQIPEHAERGMTADVNVQP